MVPGNVGDPNTIVDVLDALGCMRPPTERPEMTVIVTAVFTPIPGGKDALIAAMGRGIAAVHDEPGCELYAIHDAEDGTITMLEKWTTAGDLDAHAAGDAVKILQADIEGLVTGPAVVTRMTPLPAGTDAQGVL